LDWRRQLLWIDCTAALVVGCGMLAASGWLAELYSLPQWFVAGNALVNLAYGTFSWSLARRPQRSTRQIGTLAAANAGWAVVCVLLVVAVTGTASGYGRAYLAAEGVFVATMAWLEWRHRALLLAAPASAASA
jgi:hypothetical protein